MPALLDLNLQHDAEIVMVKGAVLTDTDVELRVQAELREDSAASRLVRRGALKGLSVEFAAKREAMVNGVRVVELAKLAGAGLVDQGAYPLATVEVRGKGRTVRGNIVPGWQRLLACQCQSKDCNAVSFDPGAFTDTLADPNREILGVMGDYDRPLASRRRGTLRIEQTADGVSIELDLPDGPGGAAVEDAAQVAPLYVRPYLDPALSEFVDEGDTPGQKVRRYLKAHLRAVIVGATDATSGLTEAVIVAAGRSAEPDPEVIQMPRMRRWR